MQAKTFLPLAAAVLIGLGGIGPGLQPASADPGFCPPGLAKKHNGCNPPGHAGNYVRRDDDRRYDDRRYDDRDVVVLRVGERVDRWRYNWINDPRVYGLAPAHDGWRYARVDRQIVRVDSNTLKVLALVRAVDNILD